MFPSFKSFTYHLSIDAICSSLLPFLSRTFRGLGSFFRGIRAIYCRKLSRKSRDKNPVHSVVNHIILKHLKHFPNISKHPFNGLWKNHHCGTWIARCGRSKALSRLQAPHMAQEMVSPKRCPSPNQVSAEKLDTSTLPVSTSQQSTAPSPKQ